MSENALVNQINLRQCDAHEFHFFQTSVKFGMFGAFLYIHNSKSIIYFYVSPFFSLDFDNFDLAQPSNVAATSGESPYANCSLIQMSCRKIHEHKGNKCNDK